TAGRSTLTATSRPSFSTPRWTWAIDALATGSRSREAKISSMGLPRPRSISANATSEGNGGTRSCSFASSSAMSSGSRSRRVESTWPNLTKIGPRRSSASRSRWPRGSRRRPASRRSPKPSAMAKMRTRRASLSKPRDPLLQGAERRVQRLDVVFQGVQLGAPYHEPRFVGGVGAQRLGDARRGLRRPARESARRAADAHRGDVAHHARELLLEVPAQLARERAHLVGERRRALDTVQRDRGLDIIAAGLDAAACADPDPEGREQGRRELDRLAGEAGQARARPGLPLEQPVE